MAVSKAGRILPEATHLEPSFYGPLGVIDMSHHHIGEGDCKAPAESNQQREGSALSIECFQRNGTLLLSSKHLKPR